MDEKKKILLIKLAEDIYKIKFGEIKLVFQDGFVCDILTTERERVKRKK